MGLLGGLGDAIGSVADSAADAIGVPEGIQDAVGAGFNAATGDFADAAQQTADLAGNVLGDGGNRGNGGPPARTQGGGGPQGNMPTFPSGSPSTGGGTSQQGMGFNVGATANPPVGPSFGGQTGVRIGLGPQGQGGQQQGQQQGQGMMQSGNFMQTLMADMLEDAVQGSTSRAILEAMQSGSLQGGIIQQPVKVQTPRGPEFHSRPGFRTVTLNNQKVSVFKPVAKALGLLPNGERTFREKADDAAREYLKMRRRWKDLASKFGFKQPSSRKSGPKR